MFCGDQKRANLSPFFIALWLSRFRVRINSNARQTEDQSNRYASGYPNSHVFRIGAGRNDRQHIAAGRDRFVVGHGVQRGSVAQFSEQPRHAKTDALVIPVNINHLFVVHSGSVTPARAGCLVTESGRTEPRAISYLFAGDDCAGGYSVGAVC